MKAATKTRRRHRCPPQPPSWSRRCPPGHRLAHRCCQRPLLFQRLQHAPLGTLVAPAGPSFFPRWFSGSARAAPQRAQAFQPQIGRSCQTPRMIAERSCLREGSGCHQLIAHPPRASGWASWRLEPLLRQLRTPVPGVDHQEQWTCLCWRGWCLGRRQRPHGMT